MLLVAEKHNCEEQLGCQCAEFRLCPQQEVRHPGLGPDLPLRRALFDRKVRYCGTRTDQHRLINV